MAVIKIEGQDLEIPSSPARNLLGSLLMEGFPIRHDCGGKAMCGTCLVRIKVISGVLDPVSPRERTRLDAIHARPGERLACQCHASGDIEIRPRTAVKKGGKP